ncbi:MAG: hypothetical protein KIS91_13245 [Anaerolineae bacterium]|nr:hypothetical protein [Anaerolineae bacterium]
MMPRLVGRSTQLPWLCTDDLGAIAAQAFARPDEFIGQTLTLASDLQSLDECRVIYREEMGKNPPHFPMPSWLFQRFGFVGKDLTMMWRWLGTHPLDIATTTTHRVLPEALTVRQWLGRQKASLLPKQ